MQLGNLTLIDQIMTEGGSVFFGDVSAAGDIHIGPKNVGRDEVHGDVYYGPVTITPGDDTKPDSADLHHAYIRPPASCRWAASIRGPRGTPRHGWAWPPSTPPC